MKVNRAGWDRWIHVWVEIRQGEKYEFRVGHIEMSGEYSNKLYCVCMCLAAQSCPNLCDLMDCSPPGSSVHGYSPGKNTGVNCHAFLQGIFPTQRLNPGVPHCRWNLHHLSHQGSPISYTKQLEIIIWSVTEGWSHKYSFENCQQTGIETRTTGWDFPETVYRVRR